MTKMTRLLLLLCALSAFPAFAVRPRVAVVLSGGGAKGTAHIGALRVIEEAGIPVDMVVGTSMGSIIGGLYAIGYTPAQLDSIFMAQDWVTLLSDKTGRDALTLQDKEQGSRYILSIPFFEKPQDAIGGGVVKGRNIGRMLWRLTEGYHDSIDFRKMPVPFACISQDLVTGEEVVFRDGVLPVAIRASMSIPGAFAPVSLNGRLLIDGGIINNYPADVARQMGADIVIGVDVQDPMKTAEELQNNIFAQVSQLIDLQGKDRWERNVALSDIYVKVDVKGYNTASFTTAAIDSLVERGAQAARRQMDALKAVGRLLGPGDSAAVRPVPPFLLAPRADVAEEAGNAALKTLVGDTPGNSINLGLRFDNEELAALLFNGRLSLGKKRNHRLGLTLRLGRKTYGDVHYDLDLGAGWKLATGYRYTYDDFNIYEKGKRAYGVNFNHQLVEAGFGKSWKNVRIKLGGIYCFYNYGSFLYRFGDSPAKEIDKESYLKFGAQYTVNTLDDNYFPTKGGTLGMEYHYAVPLNGSKAFHTAAIRWDIAFSFNSRFTLTPRVEGRYLTTENTVAEMNTLGGQERGKYFSRQIPFYGIKHLEMSRRALVVAGIEARQRVGGKHYVSGAFNVAATSDDWMHFFRNSFGDDGSAGFRIFGGAIRYDLRTFIGPIGIALCFSDRAKTSGYIRAGFSF